VFSGNHPLRRIYFPLAPTKYAIRYRDPAYLSRFAIIKPCWATVVEKHQLPAFPCREQFIDDAAIALGFHISTE